MTQELNVYKEEGMPKPLSAPEEAQLERLEGIVRQDLKAFIRVGNALTEIRERGIYRLQGTFEQYCRKKFDLGESHSYRLIDAARVVENLKISHDKQTSPIGERNDDDIIEMMPANEAQVRPLLKLQPDQQREVWQAVINQKEQDKKITAGLVGQVVKKYLGDDIKKQVRKARKRFPQERKISGTLQMVFNDFLIELERESDNDFATTSKDVVANLLDQLRVVIAGDVIEETAFSSGDDANKLEKAGYKLFRMDKTSKNIKIRVGGNWHYYEDPHRGTVGSVLPFETITEMEAAFVKLMANAKHLRG